jgi:hypothetical protein
LRGGAAVVGVRRRLDAERDDRDPAAVHGVQLGEVAGRRLRGDQHPGRLAGDDPGRAVVVAAPGGGIGVGVVAEREVVDGGDQRPATHRRDRRAGGVDQVEGAEQVAWEAGAAQRHPGAGGEPAGPGEPHGGGRRQPDRRDPFRRVAADQEPHRSPVDRRLGGQVLGQRPHVPADAAGHRPQQLLGDHPDGGRVTRPGGHRAASRARR